MRLRQSIERSSRVSNGIWTAYDHYTETFQTALDRYVECVQAADLSDDEYQMRVGAISDRTTEAVDYLREIRGCARNVADRVRLNRHYSSSPSISVTLSTGA